MATLNQANPYGDIASSIFGLMPKRFPYLMKNATNVHSVPIIETGKDFFAIEYKDRFTRSFTYDNREDLMEQLTAANTNLRPREAWEFHH